MLTTGGMPPRSQLDRPTVDEHLIRALSVFNIDRLKNDHGLAPAAAQSVPHRADMGQ
jgi:hypothetical protein